MKNLKLCILGFLIFGGLGIEAISQDLANFTQFYFNPALLNPSLTGIDGRPSAYLSYRKQWAGIPGAPTLASLSLQTGLPTGLALGLNVSNNKNGLLSNSGLMLTGGYAIPVSKTNSIRFGISLGTAWNKVDIGALNFGTTGTGPDNVQAGLLANSMQILGNVGFSFHSPTFHGGISVPNIFEPTYLNSSAFSVSKVSPFESVIIHASNRLYFAQDKNVFEPYVIYRYNQSSPSQIEAAAVVHLQNIVWFGGSYKQNFGISALAGFKMGQAAIGYSYSFKNTGLNQLNSPSHEVHLGLLMGKRNKKLSVYSFIDTEKGTRKTPRQLAEEKRKRELAKKQEIAKKQKELQAKKTVPVKKETTKKEPEKKEVIVAKEPVKKETQVKEKTPVKVDSSAVKTAGPRMKQKVDPIEVKEVKTEDAQHKEEQEKIARLAEHAENPTEEHGLENDAHPHAERHEFVKRGTHVDEMEIGDYVIAGVFRSKENAKHFSDGLINLGFKTSDFGYLTEKNLWYVYLGETEDIDMARTERDKYRKLKMFKDVWLLTVHH